MGFLGVKTCEVFLCFLDMSFLGSIVLTSQWFLCIHWVTSLVSFTVFFTSRKNLLYAKMLGQADAYPCLGVQRVKTKFAPDWKINKLTSPLSLFIFSNVWIDHFQVAPSVGLRACLHAMWSVTSLREPGERNLNAVSHKRKRAPIQFNLFPSALAYGIRH